jgi:lysophospholipase L1-like esterase
MIRITGDWQLSVAFAESGCEVALAVAPPPQVAVRGEEYTLAETGMAPLRALHAEGAPPCDRLDAASLVVSADPDGRETFEPGRDYDVERCWGCFGRRAGGRIASGQKLYVSYRYGQARIDTIARIAEAPRATRGPQIAQVSQMEMGGIGVIAGSPHPNCPRPPDLPPECTALANVWLPGGLSKLAPDNVMPILETACPPACLPADYAERLLPRTMAALRRGRPLRILAWGDSVTAASWLPPEQRWAQRFAAWLAGQYPAAKIDLRVAAWAGHTSMDFLADPSGAEHNYVETVLAQRPDLVVSMFVNDAKLDEAGTAGQYARYLADFRDIGAEWVIMTPHYTQPSWMKFTRQVEIDDDGRPFVRGLRRFAAASGVPLADASRRWGRLWRQGIPYTTLLGNGVNHPTADGLGLFVDALAELFGGRRGSSFSSARNGHGWRPSRPEKQQERFRA